MQGRSPGKSKAPRKRFSTEVTRGVGVEITKKNATDATLLGKFKITIQHRQKKTSCTQLRGQIIR